MESALCWPLSDKEKRMMKRPNFVIIQVDQLTDRALKAYGGKYDNPAIDSIFADGVGFDSCTCQYPLCQPSRASLWSGLYPHETNVLSNGRNWPVDDLAESAATLGSVFSDAGYECMHFGKTHDAGALRGFKIEPEGAIEIPDNPLYPYNQDTFRDVYTSEKANEFLSSYSWDKPLLMAVDFVNPHNICGYVGKKQNEVIKNADGLPELPPNYQFDDIENRSKSIQYICCSHNRQAQVATWKENEYRGYLAAYHHYLSLVDKQIGTLLDILRNSNGYDNTYVVFISDHGDGMAARGSVTKQVAMYHETVNVPFAFAGPLVKNKGSMVKGLAENLDLFPTLCALAGIEAPASCRGISLASSVLDLEKPGREYASTQWFTEWGYTISPARMIATDNYRYIYYLEDKKEELYNLADDPYEMRNIADDAESSEILMKMRGYLSEQIETTGDSFYSQTVFAPLRWRSHRIGYHNHVGIAAPMEK